MLGQCDWTSSKPSFERLNYRRFASLTSGYVSLGLFKPLLRHTPNTMFASMLNFRLISRATFSVGSHFPEM